MGGKIKRRQAKFNVYGHSWTVKCSAAYPSYPGVVGWDLFPAVNLRHRRLRRAMNPALVSWQTSCGASAPGWWGRHSWGLCLLIAVVIIAFCSVHRGNLTWPYCQLLLSSISSFPPIMCHDHTSLLIGWEVLEGRDRVPPPWKAWSPKTEESWLRLEASDNTGF